MTMKRKLAAAALSTLVGGAAMIGLAPGAGAAGLSMSAIVDDWCGTPFPRRFPIPPPDPDPFGGLIVDRTDLVTPALGAHGLGGGIAGVDLGGVGAGGFGGLAR